MAETDSLVIRLPYYDLIIIVQFVDTFRKTVDPSKHIRTIINLRLKWQCFIILSLSCMKVLETEAAVEIGL
jgi:hypothetical protein